MGSARTDRILERSRVAGNKHSSVQARVVVAWSRRRALCQDQASCPSPQLDYAWSSPSHLVDLSLNEPKIAGLSAEICFMNELPVRAGRAVGALGIRDSSGVLKSSLSM
jgi:hypothetical protein